MSEFKSGAACLAFLHALDDSDIEVDDWTAEFIDRCFKQTSFSDRQIATIARLESKYGHALKWDRDPTPAHAHAPGKPR